MSCPVGSRAFATSDFWPIAGARRCCLFAARCWRSNLHRFHQRPQPHPSCGSALVVRDPCASSNGSPPINSGRWSYALTVLRDLSVLLSWCAFADASLELCLLPQKPRFSGFKPSLLASVSMPSATTDLPFLREDPIFRPTLLEKSAFKTHS